MRWGRGRGRGCQWQWCWCRASLSIAISVLCLFLASLGVCFCIRKSECIVVIIILIRNIPVNCHHQNCHHMPKRLSWSSSSEQVAKRPGRYDEMPKSATMENRQNMEQHVRADFFFFLWIVWFRSLTTLSLSVLCNGPATEESWADPLLEWLRGGHNRAAEESGPLPGELSTFYLLSLSSFLSCRSFPVDSQSISWCYWIKHTFFKHSITPVKSKYLSIIQTKSEK